MPASPFLLTPLHEQHRQRVTEYIKYTAPDGSDACGLAARYHYGLLRHGLTHSLQQRGLARQRQPTLRATSSSSSPYSLVRVGRGSQDTGRGHGPPVDLQHRARQKQRTIVNTSSVDYYNCNTRSRPNCMVLGSKECRLSLPPERWRLARREPVAAESCAQLLPWPQYSPLVHLHRGSRAQESMMNCFRRAVPAFAY